MPRAFFIVRVYGLSFSSQLNQGDRFFNELRVTNDRNIATAAISPSVQVAMGTLEADWLRQADAIVYGHVPWNWAEDPARQAISIINLQMIRTRMLLQALWLVKDHAAGTEQGFLIVHEDGPQVSSNSFSPRYTRADGSTEGVVAFTREELREARRLLAESFNPRELGDLTEFHRAVNDATRVSRALYFVEGARASRDLSLKVANYCTGLECLLASETGELTHRLGERLARLLGSNLDDRKAIYATVKSAYEVRSRTVHGSKPGAQYERLAPLTQQVDDLMRRILRRVVSDDQLRHLFTDASVSQETFREFLLNLTLG